MNILKIIHICVAFCVIFTCVLILRWLVLPHLKVWVRALPPAPIWESMWAAAMAVGQQLLPWILAAFLFLYLIYKIIQMFVCKIPLVGKVICKIVNRIPPFPELKQAGIFNLFDAIFGIVFSFDTLSGRLKRLGLAILNFIQSNFTMVIHTTDEALGISQKVDKLNSNIKLPTTINLTNGQGSSDYTQPQPTPPPENPIIQDEQREVDDKYQLCVAENTTPITGDITDVATIKQIQLRNNIQETICKANKLQTTLLFMGNKYTT